MKSDEEFIDEYRPLVAGIARGVCSRGALGVEADDLMAAGYQGLLEARQRYEASRGVRFRTFAYYRVRGAMFDWLRAQGFHSRRAWDQIRQAESADLVGESVAEQRAADPRARTDRKRTAASLEGAVAKLTTTFVMAAVGQDQMEVEPEAEAALIGQQTAAQVRAAIEGLPEREQALLRGFYFENRRFDEVAGELGISKSWASRLHTKALETLKKRLRDLAP